ncbi:MAG: hypothetical protein ACREAA_12325 [Candidatus Polarisedimenticolia bacterium]
MSQIEFDGTDLYHKVRELITWVYALEDRFPDSEIPVLYTRLKVAAVDLGSSVAEGLARDGAVADGALPAQARRECRGRLGVVRHLVLVSASQFMLDEGHVSSFDKMYQPLRDALAPHEGDAPGDL